LTSPVVAGEGIQADVAGRRAFARCGAPRLALTLALASAVAFGGGVLAGLDETRADRAVALAQSENCALRNRRDLLREQLVAVADRLAEKVEPAGRVAIENTAGR
jgi:2-methylcitrate dehydratase PrpD